MGVGYTIVCAVLAAAWVFVIWLVRRNQDGHPAP